MGEACFLFQPLLMLPYYPWPPWFISALAGPPMKAQPIPAAMNPLQVCQPIAGLDGEAACRSKLGRARTAIFSAATFSCKGSNPAARHSAHEPTKRPSLHQCRLRRPRFLLLSPKTLTIESRCPAPTLVTDLEVDDDLRQTYTPSTPTCAQTPSSRPLLGRLQLTSAGLHYPPTRPQLCARALRKSILSA